MSISAEPSLVDQHSAVACSPAEPLWNQASASLSEKNPLNPRLIPESSPVPFCIFKMKDKCWKITFEVSDLPAARAWSSSAATHQRIERIHRNHTPDVDHGQPQFLRVVFSFSVFLSPCIFSLDKGGHHNYIMNEANRRSLENPPALKTNWGELMLWFGDYILHSGDTVPREYQEIPYIDGLLKLCSPVRR